MKTNRTMKLAGILLLGVMLVSACTQTYSQTPSGTPTLIPTGLFVSPFPSGQDPLQIIAQLGTQTAQAALGTVEVAGTPGTPSTVTAGTPGTETAEATEPTTSGATLLPVTVIPGGSTFTATSQPGSTIVVPTISGTQQASTSAPVGSVPATYTLQKGEWPYCIARRFDLNPQELLDLNHLTVAQSSMLMPGLVLSLPQTSGHFPPPRAWHTHPSTWTVDPGDTLNSIACYYGDLSPQQIATANNLSTGATLTTGTSLTIP